MSALAPRRVVTVDLDGAVLGVRAEVVSTKRVEAGHAVSYGSEYRTAHETTLALVAAGYGDGVPRLASGAPVTIGELVTPIRGRVAMDQVVLDVGDHEVPAGSMAVLWGAGGASAEQWGATCGFDARALAGCISPRADVEVHATVPDAEAMEDLGRRLASVLRAGDVVVLTGELGAGKTTLTRGIGEALGAVGTVQSPTFVIARTHRTRSAPLLHVDAYRLGDEAELDDLDLDLDGSITVAEWGLPLVHAVESYLHVEIERPTGAGAAVENDLEVDEPRSVRISAHGPAWRDQRILTLVGGAA